MVFNLRGATLYWFECDFLHQISLTKHYFRLYSLTSKMTDEKKKLSFLYNIKSILSSYVSLRQFNIINKCTKL